MASPVDYTFDVTAGQLTLEIVGVGSTATGMSGTFGMTLYQSDGHIGESDSFVLGAAALTNTDHAKLSIAGLATANVLPGSAQFLEFIQPDASHIGAGGVSTVMTDAFLNATVLVSGALKTTFLTSTNAGILLPLDVAITTSANVSDIATASIAINFPYEIGIADISITLTLDLIVNVTGTAHVAPDPALGGLTALGLGGAGAWLRRRRS
jgi:hypothetical protein